MQGKVPMSNKFKAASAPIFFAAVAAFGLAISAHPASAQQDKMMSTTPTMSDGKMTEDAKKMSDEKMTNEAKKMDDAKMMDDAKKMNDAKMMDDTKKK
jgi:hypothetical protein